MILRAQSAYPPPPCRLPRAAQRGGEPGKHVGVDSDKPYLNVASVGVASKVARAQSKKLKKRWRVFAYVIGLLRALQNLKPFFVHLDIDGAPAWSGSVYQVSIGK